MNNQNGSFLQWVMNWDFMAIFYSFIAMVIGLIVLKWGGLFFRFFRRKYEHKRAIQTYKKNLAEECGLLIVVGRRKGFKLEDVYVRLDTAPSDLMAQAQHGDSTQSEAAESYVLVGGPGSGKSTSVKHMLMEHLELRETLPIFLRLRDYQGFDHIEANIVHRFASAGFEEPERFLQDLLRSGRCFCVLDGLDEVRPQMLRKTIADINTFYHKYFVHHNRLLVTCRKEAYRTIPLDLPYIMEVRPLTDEQVQRFAQKWPLGYTSGKSADTFWRDLASTPRILELARSPLLLVGGLMQYTESNMGIPEERFEYLGRVARWLVSDWALAQGHPPDPFRQVYDRLLARLAYFMHKEERSDIGRDAVEKLFDEWLPTFGQTGVSANALIESIATRTGIVVSDDRNFMVFAQFGLQEYFASLELVQQEGVEKLAYLEPPEWWRDVILLAVAQQREPTHILSALFEKAPLIAAAAVAECPTPSTAMQERAISVCLQNIDKGERAVGSAVVPLLRKVQDTIETSLCDALETRLTADEPVASVVGVALATAGTSRATNILAKHPEIWDRCLHEAGYLSANFENLLVGWIKNGTEFQSAKAAELIASRFSNDRLRELLDLLPTLRSTRSDTLACLILDHWGQAFHEDDPFLMDVPITTIASRCTPFVVDREGYLSHRVEKSLERMKEVHPKSVSRYRFHMFGTDVFETTWLVATCLFMEDKKNRRLSETEINRSLNYTLLWASRRKQLLLWTAAGLSLGAMLLPTVWGMAALFAVLLFATVLQTMPEASLPWERTYFRPASGYRLAITYFLIIASALIAFLLPVQGAQWLSTVLTNVIVSVFILGGLVLGHSGIPWFVWLAYRRTRLIQRLQGMQGSATHVKSSYAALFFVLLAGLTVIVAIFHDSALRCRYAGVAAGGAFSIWSVACIVHLKIKHSAVVTSARRAKDYIDKIVETMS